jgi:hypothetical protein
MAETTTTPEQGKSELDALAAELLQDLRKIRDRIPQLTLPHKSQPRLTGIATRIPQAAIDAAFAACGTKEALAKSIDVEATHFDETYSTAFAELRDELKTTYRGLDYTIRLKRFNVGQAILRVLNIARRLAKSVENANLRSHIDVMDKALHPRRNSKKAPEPTPAAAGTRLET